jgi:tetratricopeptide (TPR) repeat protein
MPRPRRDVGRLATALVLSVALTPSGHAAAQSQAACNTPDCTRRDELWVPAGRIHEIKNQFVDAVRQFTEAAAGTFGDEGPQLLTSLDAARTTLARWDAALRSYEMLVAAMPDSAEVHVALATVYLDRDWRGEALRELAAAARLDSRRADVYNLAGLAYAQAGKPSEAAEAFRAASALDGADPITFYSLAQQLMRAGQRDQGTDALRRFQESEWPRLRRQPSRQPSTPFERVSLLRQAAGVAPIFPLHPYRPGFVLLLSGQYDAAIAEFARAATADPLTANGIIAGQASALRRGQSPEAIAGLEQRLTGPASGEARAEILRILATAYWVDGQFERSIARLGDAIRLAPENERARIALADVLLEAGSSDEAERALTGTIAVIPGSGHAHYRLGQLFQSRSLLPQAVREFEAAAALDPLVGLDRLYETIGGIYTNQASFDQAIGAYLKRIDANPNNGDAHKSLGEIYFLQGRHDEALAEFAATLLIDPGSAGALVGASQVFLRQGRFDESRDFAAQALALDSRLKDARYAHAMSLVRLGRTDEGRRELEVFERMQTEVMAGTQRQSELNTIRRDAAARLKDGDFAAAAPLLRRGLTLDPKAADIHRDLGIALSGVRQFKEAAAVLEGAVQLEDSAQVHQLLAEAYKALGRTDDSQTQTALAARVIERAKAERLQKLNGAR